MLLVVSNLTCSVFQSSSNGHPASPVAVSVDNGKEEVQNGPKVTPGGPVGPKDQLDYMVKVLGLTAVYQEFPKKQHASMVDDSDTEENTEAKVEDEVFTLLSISTDPPQVSVATGSLYGWSVFRT